MAIDPLGNGPSFPLRTTPRGGIASSGQVQKITESIRVILGTQFGERVMRPDFGANLKSLTFAPNSPATANLARHYVQDALTKWEPRITLLNITVDNDMQHDALSIEIQYRMNSSVEVQSLVVPVNLLQG